MKEQFYFKDNDSEVCYNEVKFIDYMANNDLKEIEVYKAEPERRNDVFWCQVDCFCGEDTKDSCGKQCPNYEPRNKVSGRCRYHSNILYYPGEKITLTFKN